MHIVRFDEKIVILGSECYKKCINQTSYKPEKLKPLYGSSNGIHLSEYERELLLKNTERLISEFESKFPNTEEIEKDNKTVHVKMTDDELYNFALQQTKEDFRKKRGIDPELPGFKGWARIEAEKLYKQLKENG